MCQDQALLQKYRLFFQILKARETKEIFEGQGFYCLVSNIRFVGLLAGRRAIFQIVVNRFMEGSPYLVHALPLVTHNIIYADNAPEQAILSAPQI